MLQTNFIFLKNGFECLEFRVILFAAASTKKFMAFLYVASSLFSSSVNNIIFLAWINGVLSWCARQEEGRKDGQHEWEQRRRMVNILLSEDGQLRNQESYCWFGINAQDLA